MMYRTNLVSALTTLKVKIEIQNTGGHVSGKVEVQVTVRDI